MIHLYAVAYLVFLGFAFVATLLQRRRMLFLLWPVIFLYPYQYFRARIPGLFLGLHDIYVLSSLLLVVVMDSRRIREGLRRIETPGRTVVFLLFAMLLVHLSGDIVHLFRHPTDPVAQIARTLFSDLRFVAPVLVVLAWIRSRDDVRKATLSFVLATGFAFLVVVLDRFSPAIYDLFNHTNYVSTPEMHRARSVGGFGGPWEVGAIGAVFMVFLVDVSLGMSRLRDRVLVPTILVLTLLGMVFSMSRGGMVAALVGGAGIVLLSSWSLRLRAVLVLVLVALALLSLRFVGDAGDYGVSDLVLQRLQSAYDDGTLQGTAGSRVGIWRSQWDILTTGGLRWDQLLLGLGGMGGALKTLGETTHSGFLGPIIYYGLAGGAVLLGLLALILLGSVWLWRSGRPASLVVTLTVLANMVGNEFLVSSLTTSVFAFVMVLLSTGNLVLEKGSGTPN